MAKEEHNLFEVLEFCKTNHLPARVVGKWVWIQFDVKPPKEVRDALKDFGFRWSKRRGQWSHSCGNYSLPARSYRPWDKYRTIDLEAAYKEAQLSMTA